jgi:hypothetical protein
MRKTVYCGMPLKLSEDMAKQYTPEQREYIEKYAAGLLISWTADHITNFITPDIGDGFDPPEGVFPAERDDNAGEEGDIQYQAQGDVIVLLDKWLDDIATQVGFEGKYPGNQAADALNGGTKYPTFPSEEQANA